METSVLWLSTQKIGVLISMFLNLNTEFQLLIFDF